MNAIAEFWNARNAREQLLLVCLGVVVLGAIWFLVVVVPLQARVDSYREEVVAERALLESVNGLSGRMQNLPAPRARSDTSMLLVANRSLRDAGLDAYLEEGSADGDRRVRLRLSNAPFPRVSAWLAGLAVQEGINTVTADIQAGDTAGLVQLSLVLERK